MPNNLKKKVTLIGSTGLIGTHFLEQIGPDDFQYVKALSRRKIPNLDKKDFIKQSVHNFSELEKMRQDLKTDVLVSALGTTIKKVGSKDKFIKIDHDLPLKISRIAKEEGCRSMILISAMGANNKSNIYYSHVKGLQEKAIEEIGFETKSSSQIIPIIIGNEKKVLEIGKYLFKNGIYAQPIRYPTVKKNSARIRFSVTAWHTKKQINETLTVIEKCAKKFKII